LSSPGSGGWLAWLCASRVLSAAWFVAYSAVLPLVREAWGLSAREAGMIQGSFHLGYLVSLFVVGFLADHFGAKRAFLVTGVAGFLTPILFVVFVEDFWSALWLHALTGLTQGGYYTPVLAMVNDNVERQRRGRAMGFLIAASSAPSSHKPLMAAFSYPCFAAAMHASRTDCARRILFSLISFMCTSAKFLIHRKG